MQILTLTLENFRNFHHLEIEFQANLNAFQGRNAQGKTNLLEALILLNFGKSLWAAKENDLIQRGQKFFRVTAQALTARGTQLELSVSASAQPQLQKNWYLNGVRKTAHEFIGHLPLGQFRPADLNLILLGKAQRRHYLDLILCQTCRNYLTNLVQYQHALKNRNALLLQIAERQARLKELVFWENKLAATGSPILHARSNFLQQTAPDLNATFQKISGQNIPLKLELSGAPLVSPAEFLAQLIQRHPQDLRFGHTSFGPHRQDLTFYLGAENLVHLGSRGEIRSAVLALRLAELKYLAAIRHEKPLLLLDDVFSELDLSRQKSLRTLTEGYQTFWTTTKPAHLDLLPEPKKSWTVVNGKVTN